MNIKLPHRELCINCGKYRRYFIGIRNNQSSNIFYDEKIAFCKKCHREVDAPGIWDSNIEAIAFIKGIKE